MSAASLPSLTATTIRRGLVAGRLYLGVGTMVSVVLTVVLLRSKTGVFAATFPLELPLFAALGAMGGLLLFTSDRTKGVFEYLLSYGIGPWTLFLDFLLTAVALTSIVLGASLAVGLGGYLATGHTLTWNLEEGLLLYTVPMAYSCSLFSSACGMIWSALSSPRSGLNSPLGVAPMLGVAPPYLVLIIAEVSPSADYYYITTGAAAIFLIAVATMMAIASRSLGRERFLSPM